MNLAIDTNERNDSGKAFKLFLHLCTWKIWLSRNKIEAMRLIVQRNIIGAELEI